MITISNILTSGFTFEEGEDLLRLKFRMANTMLLISTPAALLFAVLNDFDLLHFGEHIAQANYSSSALFVFSFFWLRRSKIHYLNAAMLGIWAAMITFTATLLFVPGEDLRIAWFIIGLMVAHLLVGHRFGLFIFGLSILLVIGGNYFFALNISILTLINYTVIMLISSILLVSYNEKISSYHAELLQQNEVLKKLAHYDDLTEIMSRRHFMDVANHYFSAALRNKTPISMLMLDIDHFKRINDRHGHHIGDQMLILFTQEIAKLLRKSDIFGRLGGEEFGIILFETETNGAQILAEKIRMTVEALRYPHAEKMIKMTTSIGIAEKIDADEHVEKLMIRSDQALYQSKKAGRNRISVASPASDTS